MRTTAESEIDLSPQMILNFHGIGPPHSSIAPGESVFWILREPFTGLLDLVVEARAKTGSTILLTFDDGNMSDAAIALPELAKRQLKATFFICARRIGLPHYLDREALADLQAAGMEVGTHGMDHRDWRSIDETTLDIELRDARKRIEDACGTPVKEVAVPFGSYNRRVLKRIRRERFQCVYTSDRGFARQNAWLKPRNTIDSTWSSGDMKAMLSGRPSTGAQLRSKTLMLYKRLR